MRNLSKVRCKECGDSFYVSIDSLYRNKTENHFGCVNCNNNAIKKHHIEILNNNNLELVQNNDDNTCVVKCKICKKVFSRLRTNLLNPKFLCPYCEEQVRIDKILKHQELYKDNTIRIGFIHNQLWKLYNEKSKIWYYFLGLLLSDGHFDSSNNRITLVLNEKDKDIIYYFAKILKCDVNIENKKYYRINIASNCTTKIMDDYRISNQKTYIPCDISNIKNDDFIAFIIGFIDGDGCIALRSDSKNPKITIKLHKNWEENLLYMSKELYSYFDVDKYPKPYSIIVNEEHKYSQICFSNQKVINGLYNFITNNSLFVMKRKWNKIGGDINEPEFLYF